MLVLVCTLPVPAGYFMPVFVYGESEVTSFHKSRKTHIRLRERERARSDIMFCCTVAHIVLCALCVFLVFV